MGRKSTRDAGLARVVACSSAPRARIREDLESRGIAPEFSVPVSSRLVDLTRALTPVQYATLLDGVAAAYGVHCDDLSRSARLEAREIYRLVQDFAVELKKLDEGLRILSAYLLRIRERAKRRGAAPLLH